MTLRRRVFAYVAIAAIASCVLTVGVAVVLVRHQVAAQRLTALTRAADLVASVGGARGALSPGAHVYTVAAGGVVRRPRLLGPARAALVLATIPLGGNSQGTVAVAGRTLIYAERATPNGRVVLVRGAGLAFGEWRPFLLSLILAGLGGAVLAALFSYLLARRLTRPLAELASATSRLAAGEHGVEVPVRGDDELAHLAGSFNEMSGELARAREEQRDFLESVSHELRTPLTSIRGYAEALDEGAVATTDGARVISSEARRLERLVQDLLDLARLGRSGFEVSHEPIDLAGVARRAVERHLPRARELGIELTATGAPDAPVIGDAERLLQATSNLIENALRLTPAGGSVAVDARVRAADGAISVRDTGPGLKPDDLPRAFERFYLYDRYRSERAVGSGLGLAIVEQLLARMGGSVEAGAAPGGGGGAMFTLRLPVSAPSSTEPAPARARRA
ncbi:MAG: HAMP domain-containing histidine kinase [Actinomycetota bacterium]|nr:HAMP domain-containing histidine kinase [Actinomycetota bacterium]